MRRKNAKKNRGRNRSSRNEPDKQTVEMDDRQAHRQTGIKADSVEGVYTQTRR